VVRNSGSTAIGTESKIFLSTVAGDDRGAYISSIITDASNGNALILATNTAGASPTERLRITSGGNVGIGTTSPSSYDGESNDLVVASGVDGATPTTGITIACLGDTKATGRGALRFSDGTSGNERYIGGVEYNHNGDSMSFRVGGTPKLTISSGGNATFSNSSDASVQIGNPSSGDLNAYLKLKANGTGNAYVNSIGSGSLILGANGAASNHLSISSGGLATFSNGIKFGGTPSPAYDSGADTLDAYEEGTFTVSLISNGGGANLTPSNTTGYYTRVGNKVTIQYYSGSITVTNIGSGSGVISGLPYASSSGVYHTLTLTHVNCYAALAQNGFVNPGTSQFYAIQSNTTATMAWKNSNGNYFMLGGTYLI
jgi:hypothetical protein